MYWFHWSPTARRAQIRRKGLIPGQRSVDGLWKPPYVCYADDPGLAWNLSGRIHPEIESWDLWMTKLDSVSGYETLFFDGGAYDGQVKEVRVYERVFKRDLWFVGARTQRGDALLSSDATS